MLNASRQIGTAFGVALFAALFHGDGKAAAIQVSLIWAGVVYLAALALAARASGPAVLRPAAIPREGLDISDSVLKRGLASSCAEPSLRIG